MTEIVPSPKALELHRAGPVADLHVDTLLANRLCGYDMKKRHRNPVPYSPFFFHADLPRVKSAGVNIWGLGLVASPVFPAEMRFRTVVKQLEYLRRVCAEKPDKIFAIEDARSLREGLAAGRVGAFPGLEGAHAIAGDLGKMRALYGLGMRYFTLAHFSGNEAAQCAMGLGSRKGKDRGLSDFGRVLVDEIHRMGVVLDVAHVNKPGFMEACARSEKPVIVSHTGVRGVCDHWRNIDDRQIEAIAKTGGVVGIMVSPKYLSNKHFAPLSVVVDHIMHVVKVAGARTAAYGTDLDGWLWTMPKGFSDIADLPKITTLLLERGLPEGDVAGIIGGNVKRVLENIL